MGHPIWASRGHGAPAALQLEPRAFRWTTGALLASIVLGAICATLYFSASASATTLTSSPGTALIDGDSVTTDDGIMRGETPVSLEQWAAENAGFTVTVRSGEEWEKMTAAEFAHYQLLVVGDPICSYTSLSAVESAPVWTSVVMGTSGANPAVGNRVVVGTDPEFHYLEGGGGAQPKVEGEPQTAGAEHLVQDGEAFAGAVAGATGIYFDTSCADLEEPGEAPASFGARPAEIHQEELEGPDGRDKTDVLEHLTVEPGHWTENPSPPCGGQVQQIAANPAFDTGPTKLEDEDIQGWGCSDHITFPGFPSDWSALAVATDTPSHPTCGTDPDTQEEVCGEAYVLVAGENVVTEAPNLELSPKASSDPAGGSHTVTATVSNEGGALAGVIVEFLVSGQNAGVTGTCTTGKGAADAACETDSEGKVQFTYSDTNGAGNDTINASVTIGESTEHATAAEEWTSAGGAQPTTLTTSLNGGGGSGPSITVPEGTAANDTATLAGTNASVAGGSVTYSVYSDAGCTAEVGSAQTVPVTDGAVPASEARTLPAGTYYFLTTYSGDEANLGSSSACGAEVLKVESGTPAEECTQAVGKAAFKTGKLRESVKNTLYTDLAMKQTLQITWENNGHRLLLTKLESAKCLVKRTSDEFAGEGTATLDGEGGYIVKFRLVLTHKAKRFSLHARITRSKTKAARVNGAAKSVSSEEFS